MGETVKINKRGSEIMIKDKIFCIDLDSTILDTSATIISLHNKLYPSKYIEFNEQHDWCFKPMIDTKEDLSNLFKLFDHEDFYKDVIVFPNAIEIINELAENNRVVICSKHMETRKRLSREWINKVMPKVEIRFVENFEDKGKLFKHCDYCIDDRIDTLDSFSEETTCILFGFYDWNKDGNYYIRKTNWNDIRNHIEYAWKFVEQRDNKFEEGFKKEYDSVWIKYKQNKGVN